MTGPGVTGGPVTRGPVTRGPVTGGPGGLRRFLRPGSVAVVGASERQQRSNNAVLAMRAAGVKLFFVNPGRAVVYGETSYPDLMSVGEPVDAVLSLVPAEAAVQVVADARAADAGGVVVIAGGFAESGPEGALLQRRLHAAAGPMPVLGPNCNGYVTPADGARLSGAPGSLRFPGGTVGVVTHSGALLGALALAAAERAIGFSCLVSTGNEMAIDMADVLEFLIDDEETRCIALVVETIRDPERFFAAARRAVARGKPVVALKLGRSARGREITTSHTGALAGEAWMYHAAFRQHGIGVAADLADLLDRLSLVAQLPPERWTRVDGLAVASLSGGWSAMASDVCAEEGIEVPALTGLAGAINAVLPPRSTVNPLDMTGFAMGRSDVVRDVLAILGGSDEVDALVLQWFLDEAAGEAGASFIEAAVDAAARLAKPVIIGSVEDGHPGAWARELAGKGVGAGRGLRGTARALRTMGDFTRLAQRPAAAPGNPRAVPRPAAAPVETAAGPMLPFGAAMALLSSAGIPVAPFAVIEPGASVAGELGFGPPYVLKLADVPHRSDIGAVRPGVRPGDVERVLRDLRRIAVRNGMPERVVVQPHVQVAGEAFVGVQGEGDLGPMVVFGVGGIFVEMIGRVSGKLAPLTADDAADMLDEMAPTGVFAGARGQRPWDRVQLAEILTAAGALAAGGRDWLASMDVNPLAFTDRGFVALDALCLVRPVTER